MGASGGVSGSAGIFGAEVFLRQYSPQHASGADVFFSANFSAEALGPARRGGPADPADDPAGFLVLSGVCVNVLLDVRFGKDWRRDLSGSLGADQRLLSASAVPSRSRTSLADKFEQLAGRLDNRAPVVRMAANGWCDVFAIFFFLGGF